MSQSFLSVACAGLLLAAGAYAASETIADAPADAAPASASGPAAARAKPAVHAVHVFVTMRDAAGKTLKASAVRIEGDDAVDIGVGADGAKLSVPVDAPAAVRVLFPGGNCSVTLSPKAVVGGRVTIVVDRVDAVARCSVSDAAVDGIAAAAASAASAASSVRGTTAVHGASLLEALFSE